MADRPDESPGDAQWRTAGDRIQTLLDAASTGGVVARERAEQLVREVVDLYGAGLTRIVALIDNIEARERLATDDLVASLLLVHGLHPHDLRRRVSDALDRVRPYLGSHGGDVHLIDVDGDTVRLQFAGSCKSCPSSAVTLELAVEDAIRAAAPEISAIEVVAAPADAAAAVIPAERLLAKVHANGAAASWQPVPELATLRDGQVGGFAAGELTVLVCRFGDRFYAYRDHCAGCQRSLAGAELHDAVLQCPRCGARFDAVHAGAALHEADGHLDPIPLLVRDGVLSIAVPAEPMGAPA